MPMRVYKLCRSHRKMNIWSDRCAWSNYRCVVFIQPPPQHQQHLYPARSPPQELGQSQALCMFALPPSHASISFYRHLSPNSGAGSCLSLSSQLAVAGETHGVLAAGQKQARWTRHYRSIGTKKLILCQVLITQNNYSERLCKED